MNQIFQNLTGKDLEILKKIFMHQNITKKELQDLADLPLTSLNRVMKKLETAKLISESGNTLSTGGRKATQYSVSDHGLYVVGIDISRTYVKIVICSLRLTVLKEVCFAMDKSCTPEKTIRLIMHHLHQNLEALCITAEDLLGIGIGTVGPIDRMRGIMKNPSHFLSDSWQKVPLKDMIEAQISVPCFIDNGANTAILAEYLFGVGKEVKSLAYIHCGVGIRSSAIVDGHIMRAMNDTEDSFASMIMNYTECEQNNRGRIEDYSSMAAIVTRFSRQLPQEKNVSLAEKGYKKIIDLVNHQDKSAKKVIEDAARVLGMGLDNLTRLLNPQLVILCGPLMHNFPSFFDVCLKSFYQSNSNSTVRFSREGHFGSDTIAIGACITVLQNVTKTK